MNAIPMIGRCMLRQSSEGYPKPYRIRFSIEDMFVRSRDNVEIFPAFSIPEYSYILEVNKEGIVTKWAVL